MTACREEINEYLVMDFDSAQIAGNGSKATRIAAAYHPEEPVLCLAASRMEFLDHTRNALTPIFQAVFNLRNQRYLSSICEQLRQVPRFLEPFNTASTALNFLGLSVVYRHSNNRDSCSI